MYKIGKPWLNISKPASMTLDSLFFHVADNHGLKFVSFIKIAKALNQNLGGYIAIPAFIVMTIYTFIVMIYILLIEYFYCIFLKDA